MAVRSLLVVEGRRDRKLSKRQRLYRQVKRGLGILAEVKRRLWCGRPDKFVWGLAAEVKECLKARGR
jgi:hypothetical protein